jgi:hypothetical protein
VPRWQVLPGRDAEALRQLHLDRTLRHVPSCDVAPIWPLFATWRLIVTLKKSPMMRQLDALLEPLGIRYTYVDRGKHKAVAITGPKGTRHVFISATASDHRAGLNAFRDCKRTAREVGYEC